MEKFFNIAGPNDPEDHYMLDPLRRIDYGETSGLIDHKQYFVLHAPRQTGKTTSLLAMVKEINGQGKYHCAYVNVETAQTARNDVKRGIWAILSRLESSFRHFLKRELSHMPTETIDRKGPDTALVAALEEFCVSLEKPLVLFVDEIDALIGDTLVSVLRQFRDGYSLRPKRAPLSVILCGVRDVRDYRIHMSDGDIITGGSCFNVKAESLRLGNFSQEEIRELYEQHTTATGQIFEENIYPAVWDLTQGQPWLVNALAHQATFEMPEGRDRSRPVTTEMIEEA
ncbi:MAG: ATP-binding protein, partial [Synergistaceae bacterium]|nr:ATP-binding protein [Synergistaceae bacterium]